ncbi:hypothetical protein Glove_109g298 [Diversispora epigaea]|uniref:RNase H type-1 domain-containing protein n=1 Tax=Diversispora epigaea TaxID=1348612 RepID=A0A397J611_9GLOM|nr:hypothetical protein Glove_109g298 [Diversispora epigaea]
MFVEQIMNLELENILDWQHIHTICPKRGRPPKLYTQIMQNKIVILNEIRRKLESLYKNNINVFNNLQKKNTLSKHNWIAHRDNNKLIIGGEIKNKKKGEKDNTNRMKHFEISGKNLEFTSVLIPCEGCALNMEKNNNNSCVYRLNNDKIDKIEIPVSYSTVSTTDTLAKKYKNRIRVKTKDLHKALNIIDDHIINDIEEESTVTSNIAGSSNHRNEEIIGCNILEDILLNIKKWISGDKGKLIEDNIREFPSSTRAELMAILTCLLVMPDKATVNIYTDSMCALQNMNIIKKKSGKRIWKHCKNPVILQIISEIIKEKDLTVNCYKVKTHSEIPIKEAAKEINRVKTMIDWKFQERFKHFMNSDKNKKVDWDLTFKTKHPSKITSDYTNNTDMHKRSFAMKLLCEELPTMTKRHLH